ncbi:MAG: carboxypeptidase-like regulatory domain-containing protein [Cyclobacteriaceae bacterium]|nr:carboxypeptidase-like regulatory domain-containing protein [Cyclobacteriaceae bacterium]
MKKVLQINIDTPCSENWNNFPKTISDFTLTGHCASCSKNVIDFTTWSDERIKEYFEQRPTNICGRLKSSQLKEYIIHPNNKPRSNRFLTVLLSVWLLLFARNSDAQTIIIDPPEREVLFPSTPVTTTAPPNAEHVIRGSVLFSEDNQPGAGTNVVQKGTDNGTVADENGSFVLPLLNPGPSETLVFSFIGFQSKEVPIAKQDYAREVKDVILEMDFTGGISYNFISPRRWWWSLKGLFRRY